jgi:hypothetical protein
MSMQPEALRLADVLDQENESWWDEAAAIELRRLFELAQEQHTVIYGLRLQVANLQHNNEVLTGQGLQIAGWTLSPGTQPGTTWISDGSGEGGNFATHELAEAIGAFYKEKF